MKHKYIDQVELLLQILPEIEDSSIALKGGTAINFFYRDGPRLSVDIDLTFVPILPRKESYLAINQYLKECKNHLEKLTFKVQVNRNLDSLHENKFVISNKKAMVKIEPNYIVRGSVYEVENKQLSPTIAKIFGREFRFPCISFADVYGGKLCAALERQHPRDLFDVKLLLENEGITKEIKNAFIFYLLSSRKPYIETLNPYEKDLAGNFFNKFAGMTTEEFSVENLSGILQATITAIKKALSDDDIKFLVSTLGLSPRWDLIDIDDLASKPSVKWRMMNLSKTTESKRKKEIETLRKWFEQ